MFAFQTRSMCEVKEKLFREDIKLRCDLLINECKTDLSLDICDQSCGRQSTNAVTDEFCRTWIPCTLNDPIPTPHNTLPPTEPTESTEANKGTEAKVLPPIKSTESNKDKIEQTTKGQPTSQPIKEKGHQTPSTTPSTTKLSSTVKVMSKGRADITAPGIALLVTVFVIVII